LVVPELLKAAAMKSFYILEYSAVYSRESQPTFRKNTSPPSTEATDEQNMALLDADFLLGLLFDPEDEGDIFLRKSRLTFTGIHGV
jgi:hypothetical protein